MNTITDIRLRLQAATKPTTEGQAMFFKTGEGDYAAHDQFMGVTVPQIRRIAKGFYDLSFEQLEQLLYSSFNEERLLALIILVKRFESTDAKACVYDFYLQHKQQVNNWNLVDSSAHLIVGAHLYDKNRNTLLVLANSDSLWDRRIAIVSTWYFIKKGDLTWTFKIAKLLLNDKEDLIHKATGWMLREAGKQDVQSLKLFLDEHAKIMPRTMLRYAIEKLDDKQRKKYMNR